MSHFPVAVSLFLVVLGSSFGACGGGGGATPSPNNPVLLSVDPATIVGLDSIDVVVSGRNLDGPGGSVTLRLTATAGTPFEMGTSSTLDLPAFVRSATQLRSTVPFGAAVVQCVADVTCIFGTGARSTLPGGLHFEPQMKLIDDSGEQYNEFGGAVAAFLDWVLVGARFDDTNGFDSGSAVFYDRATGERQNVKPLDGGAFDEFGSAVAISGDWAVVGASGESTNGADAGAAYIYRRIEGIEGTWQQVQKLLPSDGFQSDHFGSAVAIEGSQLVVGAPGADRGTSDDAGAAYVYEFDGLDWVQTQKLGASDRYAGDDFGRSVAIAPDRVFVGAPLANFEFIFDAGAVYVFDRQGGSWPVTEDVKLLSSTKNTDDHFGAAMAESLGWLLVGAPDDDDNGVDAGSVFSFRYSGVAWSEMGRLLAPDGQAGDQFGTAVSIVGFEAVVGAPGDDDNGAQAGSAYLYWRDQQDLILQAKLRAAGGSAGDRFGASVANFFVVVVGAPGDDEAGPSAGAAYVH